MTDKSKQDNVEDKVESSVGSQPAGGEPLEGGVPPTGDKPSPEAEALQAQLPDHDKKADSGDPNYNPTTPDGLPPANNLPGPHGPQGVEHLQVDPAGEDKQS